MNTVTLSHPGAMQPAIVATLFHAGHQPRGFDDGFTETVVVALELADRTVFVRDTLPIAIGSPLHRLCCAKDGFFRPPWDCKPGDALGVAIMADLVVVDGVTRLRKADPFPRAPRYAAAGLTITTSDPQLGAMAGTKKRVGGLIEPRRAAQYPEPPKPRTSPREWSVDQVLTARRSDLPASVADLRERSREWAQLSEPATKARR